LIYQVKKHVLVFIGIEKAFFPHEKKPQFSPSEVFQKNTLIEYISLVVKVMGRTSEFKRTT